MAMKSYSEERERLLRIMEKNASPFKYELTRLHLSEDQIESIYPIILQFFEKSFNEFFRELRSES